MLIKKTIDLFRKNITLREYKRFLYSWSVFKKINYYQCNFSEIISFGYNCEVSQRLSDIFIDSKFEHFLFSWSYEYDRNLFIDALSNLDTFAHNQYSVLPWGMIKNEKYNIAFHSRFKKEELLKPDGSYTENVTPAIQELTDRLQYLAQKLKNVLEQKDNILFILKLDFKNFDEDITFINKINTLLTNYFQNRKWHLLIVTSKKNYPKNFRKQLLQKKWDNIKIGIVKSFAPDPMTDIGGDIRGWYKLLKSIIHNQ